MTALTEVARPPQAPSATRRRGPHRSRFVPLVVITALFVASRVGFWLAGVRFDLSPLTSGSEQLLAVGLLKDQLVTSVWHLHSQPPLFNLYCGLLLHLPGTMQRGAAWVSFMAVGLVLVIATYLLLIELRVSPTLALIVALVMVVSPTDVLYENWLFYAYPTAAGLAVTGLCCARYLRTGRWAYGLGFFAGVCGVALTDSMYQAVWVVGALVLMILTVRAPVRRVLAVAAVPVLLLAGWITKDAVMFGTYTTSSWIGMNLADMTLVPAARDGQLDALVRQHRLTPLALTGPWQKVAAYVPRYVPDRHTGVGALDDRTGDPGESNYNNIAYVRVSSLLLTEDLRYIRLEPRDYLRNVGISAGVWLTPSDQYPFIFGNWSKIRPLADTFDTTLGWQVDEAPAETTAIHAIEGRSPPAAQISYSAVLIYAVSLIGAPLFLWLRRRHLDRSSVGILLFLWGTTAYTYVTSSLIDIGENNRLRFELGPLPLVLAVVVVLGSLEPMLGDRGRNSRWWRWFGLTAAPGPGAEAPPTGSG